MTTGSAGGLKPRSPSPLLMYTTALASRPSVTIRLGSKTGSACSLAQAGVLLMLMTAGEGGGPLYETSTSMVPAVVGSTGVIGPFGVAAGSDFEQPIAIASAAAIASRAWRRQYRDDRVIKTPPPGFSLTRAANHDARRRRASAVTYWSRKILAKATRIAMIA